MNDLLELFPNLNFEDEPFQDASPDVSDEPVTEPAPLHLLCFDS